MITAVRRSPDPAEAPTEGLPARETPAQQGHGCRSHVAKPNIP